MGIETVFGRGHGFLMMKQLSLATQVAKGVDGGMAPPRLMVRIKAMFECILVSRLRAGFAFGSHNSPIASGASEPDVAHSDWKPLLRLGRVIFAGIMFSLVDTWFGVSFGASHRRHESSMWRTATGSRSARIMG